MDTNREEDKIIITNFVIIYFLMMILTCIGIYIKSGWPLKLDNHYITFVSPFVITVVQVIILKFKISYGTYFIKKSPENVEKLEGYLKRSRVKKIHQINYVDLYQVKSKFSFLALKFSIKNESDKLELRAPKVLGKEILKLTNAR